MHRVSEMAAILSWGVTSIHSFPASGGSWLARRQFSETARPHRDTGRLTHPVDGARLAALLAAFLGLAAVRVDDGHSRQLVLILPSRARHPSPPLPEN